MFKLSFSEEVNQNRLGWDYIVCAVLNKNKVLFFYPVCKISQTFPLKLLHHFLIYLLQHM